MAATGRRTHGACLALLIAFAIAAAPGRAAAQDVEALISAATQLKQRLDGATSADAAPSLRNDGAALVRTAFHPGIMHAAPADTLSTSRACMAISAAILAYVAMAQRLPQHVLPMEDELSLGIATANICAQRAFRAALGAMAEIGPGQEQGALEGLLMMRMGARQMITGTVRGLSATREPGNRAIMLAGMLDDPDAIAGSLSPGERQALHAQIVTAAGIAAPADRAQLNRLATAFAEARCNLLCGLSDNR